MRPCSMESTTPIGKRIMQAYLESIDADTWLVTEIGYAVSNPRVPELAKNVFARINSRGTSHEIWNSICDIHEG